jgi:hypothetical protein
MSLEIMMVSKPLTTHPQSIIYTIVAVKVQRLSAVIDFTLLARSLSSNNRGNRAKNKDVQTVLTASHFTRDC